MKLSEGFQLLATAPEGVARLRELILSLAVQGKLVPQDPCDAPVTTVIQRIRQEKDRAIAEGKIKRGQALPEIRDDEKPYDLPNTWEWVRFNDLLPEFQNGASSRGDKDGIPTTVLRLADIKDGRICLNDTREITIAARDVDKYDLATGDILAIRVNGSADLVGRFILNDRDLHAIYCDHFIRIRVNGMWVSPVYLAMVGDSGLVRNAVSSLFITTAGQKTVNQGHIGSLIIPLPPLVEQRRIVAKVDELMRLCDELETGGRLEAEQHARLTATLFDALAASESSHALAENWARVAAHFDLLLERPEAVDALEQTIRLLAIRGLLVPQDPNDEPASELLQKIRQEKDRLIAEGRIRRDKPSQQVDENSAPFELPNGWIWTGFGALVLDSEAGWSPSCENVPRASGQWGVLKVSAVSWGEFRPEENKELPAELTPKPEYEVVSGDFLLSRANTDELVARSVVVEATEARLMMSDKIIRVNLSTQVDRHYLNLFNNSKVSRAYYIAHASGTSSSMKNVSREVILNLPVALPPAGEQSRIVARVEELRLLCAALRERLTARQTCQAHFAEAVVEQATSTAPLVGHTDDLAAAA